MWLGQAPLVGYHDNGKGKRRSHYEFRWWYEYSGGKLTDWGAHHIDIAQWAIEQNGEDQGPVSVDPLMAKHPVELKNGMPVEDDRYNCATNFKIKCVFQNGVEMTIREAAPELKFNNGIIFEGSKGTFRVSRGKLEQGPADELKDNPLPEGILKKIYKGKEPGGGNAHMNNFFQCVKSREEPISDVFHASPRFDNLPLGKHRDSFGSSAEVGSQDRANRRVTTTPTPGKLANNAKVLRSKSNSQHLKQRIANPRLRVG